MTTTNTHLLFNKNTKKKGVKRLPFTSHVPNIETRQAMIEACEITKARFKLLNDPLEEHEK